MSDVPISLYTSVVKLTGENVAPPSLPPSLEETQPAINPPGTSDISGLVPYNGAIDNVNLGEKGLSTGFVQYDNTPTDTPTGSGTVVWNPDKYTLDLSMGLGDSVQQIGMETYYTPVKNQTGSLIPDGTFVMATGSLGASGRITIAPAVTDGSVDSRYMLGVTTHDIANGGDGLVTWFGEIRGFNTNTKAPIGETWVDGTVLWNNPAVAGGFTSVEPQAPNLKIPVAIVISAGNNGVIFVRPRLGMRLTDLHDVDAFTPSDKNLISYDSALGHWNAKSLGSVIGGTSSQFLKGDGSLDSNTYALASQINITSGQVAFGTGSGVIGGSSSFTYDDSLKILSFLNGISLIPSGSNTLSFSSSSFGTIRVIRTGAVSANSALAFDSDLGSIKYLGFDTSTGFFGVRSSAGSFSSAPFNVDSVNGNTMTGTLEVTLSNSSTQAITVNGYNNRGLAVGNAQYGGLYGYQLNNNTEIGDNYGTAIHINARYDGTNYISQNSFIRPQLLLLRDGDFRFYRSNPVTANTNITLTEIVSITNEGTLGIGVSEPTNTLDVNGTARIRTLSNATGDFVTASATGVLQKRTASEVRTDIGAIGGSGTTNYLSKFTASGTIGDSAAIILGGNLSITETYSSVILNNTTSGSTIAIGGDMFTDAYVGTTTNHNFSFISNGLINAVLTTSGNFGIGMIEPLSRLTVAGTISVGSETNTTQTNNLINGYGYRIGSTIFGNVSIRSSYINTTNEASLEFYTSSGFTNTQERMRLTSSGNVGIATTSPTNILDVNGTARIRSLTGTTGYLPLLSSTGVMGQSVVYNTSAGSVLIGTINEVSGHKVRISGGALNITNWQSSEGAYDKLSIDFGEFRGIGYDSGYNEVFFAGTVTVPVKIDTDAPTDSLNVLSTGGVQMKNLQAGTISDNIGLNSSGELVKGVAGLVQSVSGTAVNNTDPLNPIISVDNWTSETLIDTITLNDTNGNVTYTCNSTITIFTNSKLNIKTLYLNITNIASSGIPLGGAFEIKGYNFYNFIGANDISVLYEVKEFRGTSYTESLLPLLRPDALGTFDGQLIFRKINNTQQQPPFTSTNGEITIKIAKFKQS